MKNILIFGGTFNPPHIAHYEIIKHIISIMPINSIENIEIMPSLSWQKINILSYTHRFSMVKLAFSNLSKEVNININISDYELNNNQNSYSLKTLQHYRSIYIKNTLYFIIGFDQLNNLHTWYKYQDLLNYAHVYVIGRGYNNHQSNILTPEILNLLKINQDSLINSQNKLNGNIIIDKWQPIDISSSLIRQFISVNNLYKASQFLNKNVLEYIIQHKLYV